MKQINITEKNIQKAYSILLEKCHGINVHNKLIAEGKWGTCEDFCFWIKDQIELSGKTIAIIGDSMDLEKSSVIASSFGMKVFTYEKYPETDNLTAADIIINHAL